MTNDLTVTTKRPRRPLAELDLMDDFLFHQILMQKEDGPEFCRILLSTILGRPIRKVQIVPQKNVLGIDTDRHGIRYTIRNQCIEDSSVPYNDGATKIFLYTKGTEGNPSQELKDMLQYMENTINENVTNQNLDTIHHIVENAKLRREVGISYMKSWEHDEMCRQEGIDYGIMALILSLQELGHTKEDTLAVLKQRFSLTTNKALEYLEQHWKP
ncbi:MAG: hypothetical protein IJ282_03970 [Lachnospiraceae bacterium]|nr:hypothetical protein [Lachnospiraceae bacterium]